MAKKGKKGDKKKNKKRKKIVDNAGHTRVVRGHYIRSDTGKTARYSIKRDLKERSKYYPAPGKPMTGDDKKVLYNPKDPSDYVILASRDRKTGKWIPKNYEGKATVAKKKDKKLRKYKVGYV